MDVFKAVENTIWRYNLISPGDTVVVGVSGGPDSLCLLHVLKQLEQSWALNLHVGHLHHGLRGAQADADAAFVNKMADSWGLPCTVSLADVPAQARQPGVSVEEAARHARYTFLSGLAGDLGTDAVAVGHNADDQTETVLMHLLRGSGLAGLRGMMPETFLSDYRLTASGADQPATATSGSSFPAIPGTVRVVRPLLEIPRDAVLRYCADHDLVPRFDRSNQDTTLFRNRLRHELLPILEQYNPQIRRILRNSAQVLGDDYALLRTLVDDAFDKLTVHQTAGRIVVDLAGWRALPMSLQRSVLREIVGRLRKNLRNINFVHIENARRILQDGHTGDRITFPADLQAVLGYHQFAVGTAPVELPIDSFPLLDRQSLPLRVPQTIRIGASEWCIITDWISQADLPFGWRENSDPWQAWLAIEDGGAPLRLRARQDGDRFQPLGMAGHSKLLGEYFANEKVPAPARDRWPLLVDCEDTILWVCGLRVDERAKVSNNTDRVLHVRLIAKSECR
ncbi:MAG: tRNA lysidine(34) synthetase TilS [Chloroflexota bacterium]|nr:tRNA lysidine(34) synthetase TilS [Chloroflexota bacterium]